MTAPSAEYFDRWYADMVASPARDELMRRHLGLPPHVSSSSLLSAAGLDEVAAALHVTAGETLLDLGCGRGGYGLEIAVRTGAQLVGVDFSAEAVRQAVELTAGLGRAARFVVGELAATGLSDASVDAVMCIDAIQFADPPDAAYREVARVLRPGGRAVLTCWEAVDRMDEVLPERVRRVDLRAGLAAAGFRSIRVEERPRWRVQERGLWEEAATLDPGDDPALRSLREEARRVLEGFGAARRVFATATAS